MSRGVPEDPVAAMDRGEVRPAAELLRFGSDKDPRRVRAAFLALLERRGFFVRTADDLERSIEEIREIGPGFDLYDLCEALAAARPRMRELALFKTRTP